MRGNTGRLNTCTWQTIFSLKKSLSSINYKRGGNSQRKQAKQLIAAALPAIYFGGVFFGVISGDEKREKRQQFKQKRQSEEVSNDKQLCGGRMSPSETLFLPLRAQKRNLVSLSVLLL